MLRPLHPDGPSHPSWEAARAARRAVNPGSRAAPPHVSRLKRGALLGDAGAIDLPARSARNLLEQVPAVRHLVLREMAPGPRDQRIELAVVAQDHRDADFLTQQLVGVPEAAGFHRAGEALDDRVDVRRMDLHPALVDLFP